MPPEVSNTRGRLSAPILVARGRYRVRYASSRRRAALRERTREVVMTEGAVGQTMLVSVRV